MNPSKILLLARVSGIENLDMTELILYRDNIQNAIRKHNWRKQEEIGNIIKIAYKHNEERINKEQEIRVIKAHSI